MRTYITKQGDMWDSIAYKELGDAMHADKIMNLNVKYLSIYVFPAGIVLALPEIDDEVSDTLPPWKQVIG